MDELGLRRQDHAYPDGESACNVATASSHDGDPRRQYVLIAVDSDERGAKDFIEAARLEGEPRSRD